MTATNDMMLSLLDRHLSGECSAMEVAMVRDWLAADPVRHEMLVADIRLVRDVAKRRPHVQSAEAAWQGAVRELGLYDTRVAETDQVKQQSVSMATPTSRRRLEIMPMQRTAWYTVAGLMIGMAVIVAGWQLGGVRLIGHQGKHKLAYTTYVTANGQRATIVLPDGNAVALNVASRLEVPADYNVGNHMVRLPVGEALFTVSHHTEIPFTVVAGPITARVLGTSFLVRHYPTDTVGTVAVHDGKVAIGTTVLAARQLIEISRTGTQHILPADASQFSFTTGILTLNSMRLSDAIKELSRWYDADITLGDPSLADRLVYGKFAAGSLAELSEVLEWTFEVRVVRTGRILTIYPKAKI